MTNKSNQNSIEILVAGVIRNGEKTISKAVAEIVDALPEFKKIHLLIVESDSSDRTLSELERISGEYPDLRYISLGNLREKFPKRSERLAYARNRYLSEFQNSTRYENCSFLLVSDLDGVTDLLTKESFQGCFEDNLTVHTANQAGPYYDIWALRHPYWSPNDCWEEHAFFRSKLRWPETSLQKSILSRMITLSPDQELVEVESAFGGLALYPRNCLKGAVYEGVSKEGFEVCEHLSINQRIKLNGFRIVVNPSLINTGYTDFSIHKKFQYKILRYLKYPIKLFSKS
jgi:glycosyltransferase involved in cell wall biosynthesis